MARLVVPLLFISSILLVAVVQGDPPIVNPSNFKTPVKRGDPPIVNPSNFRTPVKRGAEISTSEAKSILQAKKAKIETYVICDKACAFEFKYDTALIDKFLDDVLERMNKVLGEFDMSIKQIAREIWTKTAHLTFDKAVVGETFEERQVGVLKQLEEYRKTVANNRMDADFMMVITGRKFNDMNGAAFKSAMCHKDRSVAFASFMDFAPEEDLTAKRVAQTLLHEMGHSLGMSHDGADCDCDNGFGQCLLATDQSYKQIQNPMYSSCSIKALAANFRDGQFQCLLSDVVTKETYCGNGVVDAGEDCDCGLEGNIEVCDCCDATTCKFVAAGQSCLTNECQKCSGNTKKCDGETKADFTKCDNDRGYCHQSYCQSLDRSCKRLFGPTAKVHKKAMLYNNQFNYAEHNGGGYKLYDVKKYSWSTHQEFTKANGDGECGILHCFTNRKATELKDTQGAIHNSVTFRLRWSKDTKVTFYLAGDTFWNTYKYLDYFPITASFGTPCVTTSGQAGYCDNMNMKKDRYNWNSYIYTQCKPLPSKK